MVTSKEAPQDRSTPERHEEIPIRREYRLFGENSFEKAHSVQIDVHGGYDRERPRRKFEMPKLKPIPIKATTGPCHEAAGPVTLCDSAYLEASESLSFMTSLLVLVGGLVEYGGDSTTFFTTQAQLRMINRRAKLARS